MAIRERKGRAKPWQCYWNNPITGKRESVSFETKEEAEKEDSLIRHRLRFERESFRQEPRSTEKITLEQAFLLYLGEKQFSGRSLTNQVSIMRPILKRFGAYPVFEINGNEISEILKHMVGKGIKTATIRTIFGRFYTVMRWCVAHGFMPAFEPPHLPKAIYEKIAPPTPEELAAIMVVAAPHIRRVIILGAQLGCRVGPSELFRLTWDDVDLTQGILRVHGAKKNLNAPWREVPIRESLIPVMAQWAIEDKTLNIHWIIHFEGRPVSSIKTAWSNTLRRAGITRRIRPYDLRHAFATELIAAGADIGTVAKLMGHSSPTMILNHYQYVMDKQKRAAIENLPDIVYVPEPCAQTERG